MRVKKQSVKTKKLKKSIDANNATCASNYMKNRRLDNDIHEKEKKKNVRSIEKLRYNPEYRKKEIENLKQKRSNREIDEKFREKIKTRVQKFRENPSSRKYESKKSKDAMTKKRLDKIFRQKEKKADREQKRVKKLNYFYNFRENLLNKVTEKAKLKDKFILCKLNFIKELRKVPDQICTCCESLLFQKSVIKFKSVELHKSFNEKLKSEKCLQIKDLKEFESFVIGHPSDVICITCSRNLKVGKMPLLRTSAGLKFPIVPDVVTCITDMEERFISPILVLMQIKSLKPFALNPQLGALGSVINIDIEVPEMVTVLPRKFDQLSVVQIKLKRHVDHLSDYMFETVSPSRIMNALDYLENQQIYKDHGIKINRNAFSKYTDNTEMNVIVDEADRDTEMNELVNDDFVMDKDFLKSIDDSSISILQDNDELEHSDDDMNCDEVIMRQNIDYNNVKIIAPGQGKNPISWNKHEHFDEIAFPKIYGGVPLDYNKSKISY